MRAPARLLILEIMIAFHLIDLALRFVSLDRVLHFVVRSRPSRPESITPAPEVVERVVQRAIQLTRRFDLRARLDCLPRALATFWVLGRQGYPVRFLMGVKKKPFGAHAWVMHGGRVITDYAKEHEEYQVVFTTGS
jgi:hypothetical protein